MKGEREKGKENDNIGHSVASIKPAQNEKENSQGQIGDTASKASFQSRVKKFLLKRNP